MLILLKVVNVADHQLQTAGQIQASKNSKIKLYTFQGFVLLLQHHKIFGVTFLASNLFVSLQINFSDYNSFKSKVFW